MSSETTRSSLLARLQGARDEQAWHEFEARYRDLVRRYCRRTGLQESDAEDVAQAVFLALARRLPTFQLEPARGRFRDYLGRVVTNTIHRLHSSPTERVQLVGADILAEVVDPTEILEPGWEDEWMSHHLRVALRKVRAQATPETMAIFERLLAGESVEDVARTTDHTPDSIYKVKQRIGERLHAEVEQQLLDEDLPSA